MSRLAPFIQFRLEAVEALGPAFLPRRKSSARRRTSRNRRPMDRLIEHMYSDGSDPEPTASSALRIVGLASDDKHRFSKSRHESLVLLKGIGVEGDAHAGPVVRHRYLVRHDPTMPNARQVHLIPSELLETLRAGGCILGPGDLGENVLTAGLDLESLPLGTILKLGAEAAIELTGLRTPCVLIDRFRTGLKHKLIMPDADRPAFRCGVMSVVLSGGRIFVGDRIEIRFPPEPWRTLPAL
jgi:MOSC domain